MFPFRNACDSSLGNNIRNLFLKLDFGNPRSFKSPLSLYTAQPADPFVECLINLKGIWQLTYCHISETTSQPFYLNSLKTGVRNKKCFKYSNTKKQRLMLAKCNKTSFIPFQAWWEFQST